MSTVPYSAVILDLTVIGGMGGLETLRRLKEIDPEVRAIVSTGYSEEGNAEQLMQHGFCGALPKPYNTSTLSEVVSQAITQEKGD
jgi:DNA-binding NtrC family response regulator